MLRTRRVGRNERQVHFILRRRGKLFLGFFRFFLQALQRKLVFAQINALIFFELAGEIIDDTQVKVFTAEESVAVRR